MIIFAFGGVLPNTKDLPGVKEIGCKKKNCKAALNLACEYYGDNNLKKEVVRPTRLVDFEGIAKQRNVNIMLYEPKKDMGKHAGSIW